MGETVDPNAKWEWAGCMPSQLCECKRHGEVAGVQGTDVASECQANGYAVPKVGHLNLIQEAIQKNKFKYQCDSLKLNVYCYNANGCLTDPNKALCEQMRGHCDVDCNLGERSLPSVFLLALTLALGHWIAF